MDGIATCNMGSRSFEKSKEAWSSLVYNKDITQSEVLDAYKVNYCLKRLCFLPTAADCLLAYFRRMWLYVVR